MRWWEWGLIMFAILAFAGLLYVGNLLWHILWGLLGVWG